MPCGSVVKNLPAMQEMQEVLVQSLDLESPLDKHVATHSAFFPGKSHGQRSLQVSSPWVTQLDTNDATEHTQHASYSVLDVMIDVGNGQESPVEFTLSSDLMVNNKINKQTVASKVIISAMEKSKT